MAISAVQPVSGSSSAAAVTPLSAVESGVLSARARLLTRPDASTIVTLGTNAPTPLLFNAAGLLEPLLEADTSGFAPVAPPANTATAQAQSDVATLLGLNAGTTSAGIANATSFAGSLSADTAQAVINVLASDLGSDAAGTRNQALIGVLASAQNFAASGLNNTSTTANVLNAAGVFQGTATNATTGTVDALLGTDLGLAATALDASALSAANLTTPGLLQGAATNDTATALGRVLAANVELATAGLSADVATGTAAAGAAQPLTNVLLSSVDLASAAGGVTSANAATPAAVTAGTTAAAVPAATVAAAPAAAAAITAPVTPATATGPAVAAPATALAGATAAAAPAAGPGTLVTTPVTPAAAVPTATPAAATAAPVPSPVDMATRLLQALVTDASNRALDNITDPGFANTAAALFVGAAVFRLQTNTEVAPAAGIPGRPIPVVTRIQSGKAV